MQSITTGEIHSRHADPSLTLIPRIIRAYRLRPECLCAFVDSLPESDVHEKVVVGIAGFEVISERYITSKSQETSTCCWAIPTTTVATSCGFCVH